MKTILRNIFIQLLLLNFVIILNLSVKSQGNDFTTYTNSYYKFSIQYPRDWVRNYNLLSSCVFMAQSQNIYYNVNVVVLSNFEGTLEGFTLDKMNIHATGNMKYISERTIVVNGQRCKEFICTASVNGDHLKDFIYEFVKNKILYNVTITSLEENFEKTKSSSLSMINTFLLF